MLVYLSYLKITIMDELSTQIMKSLVEGDFEAATRKFLEMSPDQKSFLPNIFYDVLKNRFFISNNLKNIAYLHRLLALVSITGVDIFNQIMTFNLTNKSNDDLYFFVCCLQRMFFKCPECNVNDNIQDFYKKIKKLPNFMAYCYAHFNFRWDIFISEHLNAEKILEQKDNFEILTNMNNYAKLTKFNEYMTQASQSININSKIDFNLIVNEFIQNLEELKVETNESFKIFEDFKFISVMKDNYQNIVNMVDKSLSFPKIKEIIESLKKSDDYDEIMNDIFTSIRNNLYNPTVVLILCQIYSLIKSLKKYKDKNDQKHYDLTLKKINKIPKSDVSSQESYNKFVYIPENIIKYNNSKESRIYQFSVAFSKNYYVLRQRFLGYILSKTIDGHMSSERIDEALDSYEKLENFVKSFVSSNFLFNRINTNDDVINIDHEQLWKFDSCFLNDLPTEKLKGIIMSKQDEIDEASNGKCCYCNIHNSKVKCQKCNSMICSKCLEKTENRCPLCCNHF